MELEPRPNTLAINDELFDIVKPARLLPGMVLKSRARDAYARLGPKQSAVEEQIHTTSLYNRGFPVARVLDSGEFGSDEWYFIEESLGDQTFHEHFSAEYDATGRVSDETFAKYLHVIEQYSRAQYDPKNTSSISAHEFISEVIPDRKILANYELCGGDIDRYKRAVDRVAEKLTGSPMGVLQLDLNPFNVLERGVIDFELVGYGPLGYDSLQVSLWHRWFTSDMSSKYHMAYTLTEAQIDSAAAIISNTAIIAGMPDPQEYMQEFLLVKAAWGFTSLRSIHEEPPTKRRFYQFRAALLQKAVDAYLAGESVPVLGFPYIEPLAEPTSLL